MDRGEVKPLTRNSLDSSPRYGATAEALRELKCERAYLDGELCAVEARPVQSDPRWQANLKPNGRLGRAVVS